MLHCVDARPCSGYNGRAFMTHPRPIFAPGGESFPGPEPVL